MSKICEYCGKKAKKEWGIGLCKKCYKLFEDGSLIMMTMIDADSLAPKYVRFEDLPIDDKVTVINKRLMILVKQVS